MMALLRLRVLLRLLRILLRLLRLLLCVLLLWLRSRLRRRRGHTWSTKQMSGSAVLECVRPNGILQALQIIEQIVCALITLLRPTLAAPHHDPGKPLRDAIIASGIEGRRVRHQLGSRQLRILRIAKNVSSGNRAVKHRSNGIKVRCRRDVARVQNLLGRHVLQRAKRHVGPREVCLFQLFAGSGFDTAHAEIDDDPAHFPVGLRLHDDIAGLHVAMNDVRPMQIAKRSRNVTTEVDRFLDR